MPYAYTWTLSTSEHSVYRTNFVVPTFIGYILVQNPQKPLNTGNWMFFSGTNMGFYLLRPDFTQDCNILVSKIVFLRCKSSVMEQV